MTENKRFVLYEHKGADYILENPNTHLDFIEMLGDCLDEEEIVERLNELYDENEQLKSSGRYWYDEHKRIVNNYVDKIKEVEKENEQLKQQLEDLSFEFETQYKHHYDCRCSQSYADGTMLCSIHDEIDPESKVCKDFKGYW